MTPNGVGAQNFVLLMWVPVRGLCPHPLETEFLDFQLGGLVGSANDAYRRVAQNFVLLIWVPVRGLCPHPQGNDSLDLSWGSWALPTPARN